MRSSLSEAKSLSGRAAQWCAAFALLMGVVLVGQYVAVLPSASGVVPFRGVQETAIALLLAAASLWTLARTYQARNGRALLVALVAACLTIRAGLLSISLPSVLAGPLVGPFPGFPPVPLVGLLLACLALMAVSAGRAHQGIWKSLLVAAAFFALMPALRYLYGSGELESDALPSVALGAGALALALGLYVYALGESLWALFAEQSAARILVRRGLPLVILLPVAFGWLRMLAVDRVGPRTGTAFLITCSIVTFVSLLLWMAKRLRSEELLLRAANEQLREAHDTLEARVAERTHELSQSELNVRRTAERWLSAKEAAESAMLARTEFLARMSHEIRTPLNGALGMLDIAMRGELNDTQRDYLRTAHGSASMLLHLIDDILDFSQMDAGKLTLTRAPFRLRDIVANALRDSAPTAHAKQLELSLRVPSEIPDCLIGDALRLRQVISNLVDNACKFTSKGDVCVRVELENTNEAPPAQGRSRDLPSERSEAFVSAANLAEGRGPMGFAQREGRSRDLPSERSEVKEVKLKFSVIDTGEGIALDKQDEIFVAFAQADESITRRFGGTGLGLAIGGQLVQLMGGQMAVESELGRGSHFFFTLVLAVDVEAQRQLLEAPPPLANMRILVLEPHEPQRTFLHEQLLAAGADVSSMASEPEPALREAKAAGRPFAALIANEQAIDDERLAAVRRELGSRLALLLLTRATPPTEQRVQQLRHAHAQLTTPVVPTDLLTALVRQLTGVQLPSVPAASAPAGLGSAPPFRVLLAEDNEVNRRVARYLLEDAGYEVHAVGNGHEALAALSNVHFDAVLMDGHMPELDGLSATRELRAREQQTGAPRMPVVALTAQAMKGDRERYLAAGMDAYLTKPYSGEQLYRTLEEVTGRRPPKPPERLPRPTRSALLSDGEQRAYLERGNPAAGERAAFDVVKGVGSAGPANQQRGLRESSDTWGLNGELRRLRSSPERVYEREQVLRRLRGQVGILRQMVAIFDEEAPDMLSQLADHVRARDVQAIERTAHKLVGSVLTVGGEQAARAGRTLELSARAGDLNEVDAQLNAFERELRELRQAFLAEGDLPSARTAL